jgi:SAM-dependent methyltransferase
VTTTEYTFDNSAADAAVQMDTLETYLDPITRRRIPGLPAGALCWELGAGGGSVAVHLAGLGHTVVATDLDTAQTAAADGVTVLRHDVRTEEAPGGPFDFIHARLVLLHLPERQEVLAKLVAALKPGGHLLLEEFDCTDVSEVITATPDQAELYRRIVGGALDLLQAKGADRGWAQRAHAAMTDAGLVDVASTEHRESWTGGRRNLYDVNARQLRAPLISAGITEDELDRFHTLMADPAFSAYSYRLVSVLGRKP